MIRGCLLMCVLACTSVTAWGLPNPLADGLRRCAAETDQGKRLSCFDALAASVPKVEADQFGLTADIARRREPVAAEKPTKPEKPAEPAVLPGKIVGLHQGGRGELIFTLDNKQVWDQVQAEPNKDFKIGEDVHIEHGAMGSLWLAADKGRKTKVKRLN